MSIKNWYVEEGRGSAPRHGILAVPTLAGEDPPRARKPWQCQPWLGSRYASPNYVGDWVYKISCQKASEEERAGS